VDVGDVEDLAVRGELHVLGHHPSTGKIEQPDHSLLPDVHRDHLPEELATRSLMWKSFPQRGGASA
jgi:hypothetical protein